MRGFEQAVPHAGIVGKLLFADAIELASDPHGDTPLFEVGRVSAAQILAADGHPTAVIAIKDMMAIGVGMGLKQRGLRMPREVSLIGIDDISLAAVHDPPLTTLRQPVLALADAAVQQILQPAQALATTSLVTLFAPEWIVRAFTMALLRR